MEKQKIFSIIGIVALLAVSVLVVSAITGAVIKVDSKKKGVEVYTKSEVDALINNIYKTITIVNDTLTGKISAISGNNNSSSSGGSSGGGGGGCYKNMTCAQLYKVTRIYNDSSQSTPQKDVIRLQNLKTGKLYQANIISEGVGKINIEGRVFDLKYYGADTIAEDARKVYIFYGDGIHEHYTTKDGYVLIDTEKGASNSCSVNSVCAQLYKVTRIYNDSNPNNPQNDVIELQNFITKDKHMASIISEGKAYIYLEGNKYYIAYYGSSNLPSGEMKIEIAPSKSNEFVYGERFTYNGGFVVLSYKA